MEANAATTDDRDRKHPSGARRQIQRALQGRKRNRRKVQAQEAPSSRRQKHASKSRKIEIDENKMDQQFVSHQVSSTTKNRWWEKFSAVKHCSKI
jgi:hypothetical protein